MAAVESLPTIAPQRAEEREDLSHRCRLGNVWSGQQTMPLKMTLQVADRFLVVVAFYQE